FSPPALDGNQPRRLVLSFFRAAAGSIDHPFPRERGSLGQSFGGRSRILRQTGHQLASSARRAGANPEAPRVRSRPATKPVRTSSAARGGLDRTDAVEAFGRHRTTPARRTNPVLVSGDCRGGGRRHVGVSFLREQGPRECIAAKRGGDRGSNLARVDSRRTRSRERRQLSRSSAFRVLGG